MNALAELQHCFQDAVLEQTGDPILVSSLLVSQPGKAGFAIYANAYRARLIAALRDNYPVLVLALGDDMFPRLALAYIESQPSRFRSIRWFGEELAAFMQEHADLVPHPALIDLAKMDWALRGAFDAADDIALTVGDLAMLSPEAWPARCFGLRASVRLVELAWSVESIWHALSEDGNAETGPPEANEHTLLVWRSDLDCQWRSLGAAEAAGLQALVAAEPFAQICERIVRVDEDISATDAALMLRRWVEDGMLVRP